MKKAPKNAMTLEKLATMMQSGFRDVKNDLAGLVNTRVDELARFTKNGFDSVDQRFNNVESRLGGLEQGHEDIKTRLGQCAYTFEVRHLEERVSNLEKKVNI